MKKILRNLFTCAGMAAVLLACDPIQEEGGNDAGNDGGGEGGNPDTGNELPVVGLTVPANAEVGKTFELKGAGWPADSRISLQDVGGKDPETLLESERSTSGMVCKVPSGLRPGLYDIWLSAGSDRWKLTGTQPLTVKKDMPLKPIRSIVLSMGEATSMMEVRRIVFTYGEGSSVPVKVDDRNQLLEFPWTFETTLTQDRFTGKNTQKIYNGEFQSFNFKLSAGAVSSSSFTLWKDKVQPEVSWNYDGDGMCVYLDELMAGKQKFGPAGTPNNPKGADIAKVLFFVNLPYQPQETNLGMIYASALGMTGRSYETLPEEIAIWAQDETGKLGAVLVPVTYETDGDGYVTGARYDSFMMKFSY